MVVFWCFCVSYVYKKERVSLTVDLPHLYSNGRSWSMNRLLLWNIRGTSANLIRLLRIWWIEPHNYYMHCNLRVLRHLLQLIFLWEKSKQQGCCLAGQRGKEYIKESDCEFFLLVCWSVCLCLFFLSPCQSICPCLACTHTPSLLNFLSGFFAVISSMDSGTVSSVCPSVHNFGPH